MSDSAIYELEVRRIAIEELEDMDAFVVGLAEHDDGSGESLVFATALTVLDEQDRSLGQDTYSVSTAWGDTVYGGLTECVLQDDLLALTFEAAAADILGISQECRLHLQVDQDSIDHLKQGLGRVLSPGRTPPAH